MNKYLLVFLVIITTFYSCSKDETPTYTPSSNASDYGGEYMEGNVNGAPAHAEKIPVGQPASSLNFFDNSHGMPIVRMSKYVDVTSPFNLKGWSLAFNYNIDSIKVPMTFNSKEYNSTGVIYSSGTFGASYMNKSNDPNSTIKITSKTNDILEGTFNGTLFLLGSGGKDSVTVTNGKFKILIYRK